MSPRRSPIVQTEDGWDRRRSVRQLQHPFTTPDCCSSPEAWPRPWPESSPVWSDTVSYRRPGSVPAPDDTRAGLGFRHRQGQMTRMPLSLSKGGKLFKKGLWAGGGARLRACKRRRRRRLSAAQLRRGPLIPALTHHRSKGLLLQLQTGAHTYSDLPMVFINPFCFSSAARTLVDFTSTGRHTDSFKLNHTWCGDSFVQCLTSPNQESRLLHGLHNFSKILGVPYSYRTWCGLTERLKIK